MAIINYTDQLKYAGKGYLDAKMMPVNSVDDLKKISLTQRFEGLTITVLNNGSPQDYWLVGGITNDKWIPKTSSSDYSDLKLVLEEGFLKLMDGDNQLGDNVDLNGYFPSTPTTDLYINSVDYSTSDADGNTGIFMCFTYSDDTKKYLDMSQFVSKTYTPGNGIIIDGEIISIDSAITGKIESLTNDVNNLTSQVEVIKNDYLKSTDKDEVLNSISKAESNLTTLISAETSARENSINEINSKVNVLISDDAEKSVRTIASEEVAKVVANAPETLDTLAEIAAWIEAHPESIAELNAKIQANTDAISALTETHKTDKDALNAAISANTTAIANEVTARTEAIRNEVSARTEAIENVKIDLHIAISAETQTREEAIENVKNELHTAISAETEAREAAIHAVNDKVVALIGDDTEKTVRTIASEEVAKVVAGADESYDTLKEIADWILAHPESVADLNAKIQANTDAISALTETHNVDKDAFNAAISANTEAITAEVTAREEAIASARTDFNNAIASAKTQWEAADAVLQGNIDAVDDKVDDLATTHANDKAELEGKIVANATAITAETKAREEADTALTSDLSELSGTVETFISGHQSIVDGLQEQITTNATAITAEVTAREEAIASAKTDFNNAITAETKAREEAIQIVDDKVDALIGDDTEKTVRSIASEEVAKIVAEAPESLDTLAEIAAWIQAHPESVAELNAKIQANAEAIENAKKQLESADATLQGKIDAIDDKVDDLATTHANDKAALEGLISANTKAIQTEQERAEGAEEVLTSAVNKVANDLVNLGETLNNRITEEVSGLDEKDKQLNEQIVKNVTDINVLTEKVNALSNTVDSQALIPDGISIGVTEGESQALYVKILNKDGNLLKVETSENGEIGLCVTLPESIETSINDLNNKIKSNTALIEANTASIHTMQETLEDLISLMYYAGDDVEPLEEDNEFKIAIEKGGNVALEDDIQMIEPVILTNTQSVVDLNNHTVQGALFAENNGSIEKGNTDSYVFWVKDNAELVINGNGTVKSQSAKYSIAVWAQGGKVIINDGIFINEGEGSDLIYASNGGKVYIYGGEFKACKKETGVSGTQEAYSALNIKDRDRDISEIKVYGGKFYNFNPANNKSEGLNTNFVAEGYKSIEVEANVWEVVPE